MILIRIFPESSKAYSETTDAVHHGLRRLHEILLSDAENCRSSETGDVDEEDIAFAGLEFIYYSPEVVVVAAAAAALVEGERATCFHLLFDPI